MLYNIIIGPLQLLLEVFYKIVYSITDSKGISVISLSFIVTIATLPLYMIAESWQEKERNIQDKLKKGTERIKQTFKGDEQYMILNTYYRQNHYHPNKSEQIQIYACALVFLLLLYNSPAGLVIYWTMNNILSLIKNVFYKLKNPKKNNTYNLLYTRCFIVFVNIYSLQRN